MKNPTRLFSIALCIFSLSSFSQIATDKIVGTWDADKTKVQVYKAADKFIGNPLDKEGKKIESVKMLDLTYEDGKWIGVLYNKKKDKTFDVTCTVKGEKLILEVDAGFMTKEVQWTRVK